MTETHDNFTGNRSARARVLARELGIDLADSNLVGIDWPVLRRLATTLRDDPAFKDVRRFGWDDDTYWLVDAAPAMRSQYLAVGNSINFRFWNLDDGRLRPTVGQRSGRSLQGSMYMWRSLRECVADDAIPVLSARFLSRITVAEFCEIFRDDSGVNPIDTALDDRVANLRDLGHVLTNEWEGEFANLIEASLPDLSHFARYSSRFLAYDDPICKLTMVNAIMQSGSGLAEFDQEPLPGIDYELVRQLLRIGILTPCSDIGLKLRSRTLLNAEESVELRRAALSALILISEMADIPCDILDNKLWLNRTKCTDRRPVCRQPGREHECPLMGACEQITELGMPLEITRYY